MDPRPGRPGRPGRGREVRGERRGEPFVRAQQCGGGPRRAHQRDRLRSPRTVDGEHQEPVELIDQLVGARAPHVDRGHRGVHPPAGPGEGGHESLASGGVVGGAGDTRHVQAHLCAGERGLGSGIRVWLEHEGGDPATALHRPGRGHVGQRDPRVDREPGGRLVSGDRRALHGCLAQQEPGRRPLEHPVEGVRQDVAGEADDAGRDRRAGHQLRARQQQRPLHDLDGVRAGELLRQLVEVGAPGRAQGHGSRQLPHRQAQQQVAPRRAPRAPGRRDERRGGHRARARSGRPPDRR